MTLRDDIAQAVEQRAARRCEYCQMHQALRGATFHVEHIPRSSGGSTILENLAWACPSCNLHKSNRVESRIPGAPAAVPLFNPRFDKWNERFPWDGYTIIGLTWTIVDRIDRMNRIDPVPVHPVHPVHARFLDR